MTLSSDHHGSLANIARIGGATMTTLSAIGEDVNRDDLRETPARVSKFWMERTRGYRESATDLVKTFPAPEGYDQMVAGGPYRFYSLCEHHLVPFFGKAWVAYVPGERIIGISKLPRIVDLLSRKLQTQERLTAEIANVLEDELDPQGVGVMLLGRHLCQEMRGIHREGPTRTTALRGGFMQAETRAEWLQGCLMETEA